MALERSPRITSLRAIIFEDRYRLSASPDSPPTTMVRDEIIFKFSNSLMKMSEACLSAAHNPFRVSRLESISFRFETGDLCTLIQNLHTLGGRGAIVGPHGSGKTTLLEELRSEWQNSGKQVCVLRLSSENKRISLAERGQLNRADYVLLDGCEQLHWMSWRNFLRSLQPSQKLVITSHHEGRLPTVVRCHTTPALLRSIVQELAPEFSLSIEHSESLFLRHRGNVRHALFELYDHFGARKFVDHGGPHQQCPHASLQRGVL